MSDDIKYAIVGRELHKIVNGIDTGADPNLTIEWNTTPLLPPLESGGYAEVDICAHLGHDPDLDDPNICGRCEAHIDGVSQDRSVFATFEACPQCDGGEMRPEHAHWRCRRCGWRDSCCDL